MLNARPVMSGSEQPSQDNNRLDDQPSSLPTPQVLLEPFRYLQQHPGKEIRSQLMQAFLHWLPVPREPLQTIKRVIEMLHNASLLVDDVEDGSLLRRGRPVAHKIYGIPSTINCANLVYFMALNELMTIPAMGDGGRVAMVSIFSGESPECLCFGLSTVCVCGGMGIGMDAFLS
jgi:geranylgeranyl diphosphate synthase type 3